MKDLLEISWRRLRKSFSKACDQNSTLQGCLTEWPPGDGEPSDPPGFSHCVYHYSFVTDSICRTIDAKCAICRRIQLFGDFSRKDVFLRLAEDSGKLLLDMPNGFRELTSVVLPKCCKAYDIWILFLFDLAWAKLPGSPLHIPDRSCMGDLAKVAGTWLDMQPIVGKTLGARYCEIGDIVQASAYAADVLIKWCSAEPVAETAKEQLVQANEGTENKLENLVTLQQAAAMVSRSKRTLERYLGDMPLPEVQGGGGNPSLWKWSVIRVWLEEQFKIKMPQQFPSDPRSILMSGVADDLADKLVERLSDKLTDI